MNNNKQAELFYKHMATTNLSFAYSNNVYMIKQERLISAYHLQQAIVDILYFKALKQEKELSKKGIFSIIQECKQRNINIEIPDEIINNAHVYDRWALDYNNGVVVDIGRQSLKHAFKIITEWFTEQQIIIFEVPFKISKYKFGLKYQYDTLLVKKSMYDDNKKELEVLGFATNAEFSKILKKIFGKMKEQDITIIEKEG